MRSLIVATILGASLAVAPAAVGLRVASAAPAAVSPSTSTTPERSPAPNPSDAERYAERERAATPLEGFDGGKRLYIGISAGTLLVIVLLVLLLA